MISFISFYYKLQCLHHNKTVTKTGGNVTVLIVCVSAFWVSQGGRNLILWDPDQQDSCRSLGRKKNLTLQLGACVPSNVVICGQVAGFDGTGVTMGPTCQRQPHFIFLLQLKTIIPPASFSWSLSSLGDTAFFCVMGVVDGCQTSAPLFTPLFLGFQLFFSE